MNTQASLLTLPTQDGYPSKVLSSLSYTNRHDNGLHETTCNPFVDQEYPYLIFINPVLVKEKTSLSHKYILCILKCSKYLLVGLWINSAYSLSPCQDRMDFKAQQQNSAFIRAYWQDFIPAINLSALGAWLTMVKEPRDLTNPILKNTWLLPTDGRNQGWEGGRGETGVKGRREKSHTVLQACCWKELISRDIGKKEKTTHKTFVLFMQKQLVSAH